MPTDIYGCHRYVNRIANTPLVPVRLSAEGPMIWCKLEFLNPSGSTKDRIARFILEKAWRQGRLRCGDRVIEASSGSTGIALALMCAQMDLKFLAVMSEGVSDELICMVRAYGGDVKLTSRESGIRGAIREVERFRAEPGVFLPSQFANLDNAEAHRVGTAREIIDQIVAGRVDAVVSGVGTGGTLVGLFAGLSESGCPVVPILAKPMNLTRMPDAECCSFSGKIPGVADSLSSIFTPERVPGLITIEIHDEKALATTRELIRLGFPVGPSSGLNYSAAVEAHARLGNPSAQIVTVFPDRMEKYFTTELFNPYI